MNYENQFSIKILQIDEIVKKEFIKCQEKYNDNHSSLTEKNNSLNFLKIALTQAQSIFTSLKYEYKNKITEKNFISKQMKQLNERFQAFVLGSLQEFSQKLFKDLINAYELILNEKIVKNMDLLEIKRSKERNAKEMSEEKSEEILGQILQNTQNNYHSRNIQNCQKQEFLTEKNKSIKAINVDLLDLRQQLPNEKTVQKTQNLLKRRINNDDWNQQIKSEVFKNCMENKKMHTSPINEKVKQKEKSRWSCFNFFF